MRTEHDKKMITLAKEHISLDGLYDYQLVTAGQLIESQASHQKIVPEVFEKVIHEFVQRYKKEADHGADVASPKAQ